MKQSRRKFIATAVSGTIASVAAPMALAEENTITRPFIVPKEVFGANDRIRVAVLGVNGRGTAHISAFAGLASTDNVELAVLCDVDLDVARKRASEFEQRYKRKMPVEQDFRRVYDDKNIDAISIATPNHWHTLQSIWACQAGKDVYVEKPATHNIYEGRKLIEAAYKYNRMVQHGVGARSSNSTREAIELLRNGVIGRVYMARGLCLKTRVDVGDKGISNVPKNLDWDLWCGPAPLVPFSENYVHYDWHWHWNFGNGDVGNQGIHQMDLCMWALDVGLPERITSMGGKFLWDDCKEVPEVQTSIFHYPKEKKIIQFEVRNWHTNMEDGAAVGNIIYGDKGYMVFSGGWRTFLGEKREPGPASGSRSGGDHFKNWIDAIKARDMSILNGPVKTCHLSSALAHLGNISYRLGTQLDFDPAAERFIGNEDANNMLSREYRAPFVIPEKI